MQNGHLVDPATGYRVQRIGLTGETDGFQITGDSSIRVPYDVALPAKATSEITFTGNLSSDATGTARGPDARVERDLHRPGRHRGRGDYRRSINSTSSPGAPARAGSWAPPRRGPSRSPGSTRTAPRSARGLTFTVTGTTTVGDLVNHLNNNVLDRLHGLLRQRQDSDHGRRRQGTAGPILR